MSSADLVGVQEALAFQIDEIVAAVPGYAVVGVGRDDGRAAGEFSAILFKAERLRVADSGPLVLGPPSVHDRNLGQQHTRISTLGALHRS